MYTEAIKYSRVPYHRGVRFMMENENAMKHRRVPAISNEKYTQDKKHFSRISNIKYQIIKNPGFVDITNQYKVAWRNDIKR